MRNLTTGKLSGSLNQAEKFLRTHGWDGIKRIFRDFEELGYYLHRKYGCKDPKVDARYLLSIETRMDKEIPGFSAKESGDLEHGWMCSKFGFQPHYADNLSLATAGIPMTESKIRTLYHVYGFDGIKRIGPHRFGIEAYYDSKDEAIKVARDIADNIEDYDVPSQTITIVKRCDFDKRGLCVFEEEVWGSVLGDMSEPGLIPDIEEFLKSDDEDLDESKIREYNSNNLNPVPKDFNFIITTQFLEDAKSLGLTEDDIEELKQSLKSRAPKASIGPNVYKFEWWPKRFNLGKKEGRVIYIEVIYDSEVYLLKVYQKNRKKDLTLDEKNDIIESSRILNRNKEK